LISFLVICVNILANAIGINNANPKSQLFIKMHNAISIDPIWITSPIRRRFIVIFIEKLFVAIETKVLPSFNMYYSILSIIFTYNDDNDDPDDSMIESNTQFKRSGGLNARSI
jgi:hypothetical protein